MAYTTDIDLSHFWRLKSEIEVLVVLASDEHIPPGLQMASLPQICMCMNRERKREVEGISPSLL